MTAAILIGTRPELGKRHPKPEDWGGTSKERSTVRLNPNQAWQARQADREETLPARMRELLGMEFAGYQADGSGENAFRGFVAEVDGRRLGINRDTCDSLHRWEYNLHRHLERIVLGQVPVTEPHGFDRMAPHLGHLQKALLMHDGISPLGTTLAAWTIGRVAIDAGRRRHVLKAWGGHSKNSSLWRKGWDQLQIDLGSGVVVSEKGIILRARLPDTIVDALPGRRADEVVAHPVLRNYVVVSVSTRKNGHTLVVEPLP